MAMAFCWVVWPALVAAAQASTPAIDAGVVLAGSRAELDARTQPLVVKLSLQAKNRLAVDVDEVEVGVLYAETQEDLSRIDPSSLYRTNGDANGRVGVAKKRVAVSLASQGQTTLLVLLPLGPKEAVPGAFALHVLGYRLAEISAKVLVGLLHTGAAADEVAAMATLAMSGALSDRLAIRARWSGRAEVIEELAAKVLAPVAPSPEQAEINERVYAIRAIGILGGARAKDTLTSLAGRADLKNLDNGVQNLAVAQVVGSRLLTPVAFAVPADATTAAAVVDAALADLNSPAPALAIAARGTAGVGATAAPAIGQRRVGGAGWWVGMAGVAAGVWLVWRVARRR
jgi:hypothetical protein